MCVYICMMHIYICMYVCIWKESIEKKESELIDIFLETNEKEMKDETLFKNKKEESHVNTIE